MNSNKLHICLQLVVLLLLTGRSFAQDSQKQVITVSKDGKGNFKTIQEAINSLPETAREDRVISIKNGVYREKIFITKNHIVLQGESKDKTVLTASIARDAWRCANPDDWGVATLNLRGSDITLSNLTITNSYGFDWKKDSLITCPNDSANPQKTIGKGGHQMALRSFETTRLKVINCNLRAYAGDTVSPWNVEEGMFYFKDCNMEGGVDFYCPRGWAYAENCYFYSNTGDAAIWHDGSKFESSKTVLKNCVFNGYEGFKLGRYHKDAQFYLLSCSFASTMANQKIYMVKTTNTIQWGDRVYYFNCHRTTGDYAWHADNLSTAKGSPMASEINAAWAFDNKWNPESTVAPAAPAGERPRLASPKAQVVTTTDPVAENMLMFQRNDGSWNKHLHEKAVDYSISYTPEQQAEIRSYAANRDGTIDNEATTKEIKYLVKSFSQNGNPAYLQAAERGIKYLLLAQYANGGWPQYYPDFSSYRSQITFNDNAMVNVLNLLQDIAEKKNDFDRVDPAYIPQATTAIQKGIACILATQIKVKGKLTAWCTQYNSRTLEPEMARKFELVSLSAAESVGIVRFLLRQKEVTEPMKAAIKAAVDWMEAVKIVGYNFVTVNDAAQPKGKDRVLVADPKTTIWARFYEIGTNRPMFSGRDSEKKYNVSEIEAERRTGYAWYGNWPEKLLSTEYPLWREQHQ